MIPADLHITSLTNPKIKNVVKLRNRSQRDSQRLLLAESYRDIKRALDAGYQPRQLFFCSELFLKNENEATLIERCRASGAEILSCSAAVFTKIAYRERPDGLLIVGPQLHTTLSAIPLPPDALLVVAEAIEKPGNLGTILRTADAAAASGVIICDRCTDIHNPNVVRASTGIIFSMPLAEATTAEAIAFLRQHQFSILAATPHARQFHFNANLTGRTAIVVGAEQYGLSQTWLDAADLRVAIPMNGHADSLNVAAATTILLFEAVRQRTQTP
ncbi:MAG: RNA methyltransferase [Lentisphaerae bacterium]|jgi:TrmH family RNA methyltransferase|nr:RNA methyltransferase [Lentisphaerota bacterium]